MALLSLGVHQGSALNCSHFGRRKIWRRPSLFPPQCRPHRLQRPVPPCGLPVLMETTSTLYKLRDIQRLSSAYFLWRTASWPSVTGRSSINACSAAVCNDTTTQCSPGTTPWGQICGGIEIHHSAMGAVGSLVRRCEHHWKRNRKVAVHSCPSIPMNAGRT